MTQDLGWVCLHKKLTNWEWYTDVNTSHLFIYCLLKANHTEKDWQGIKIERGSFISSLSGISHETGLSIQSVRTSLKKLEKTENLTSKSTNKYRYISIVNYDLYQHNNKQATSKQQASNKQLTTTNNITNKQDNNITNNIDKFLLPDWIPKDAWNEFMKIRKKLKASDTDYAKKKLINQLERFKNDGYDIESIIDKSIINNWKGVFEPKEKPKLEKDDNWAKSQLQALREVKV